MYAKTAYANGPNVGDANPTIKNVSDANTTSIPK